MCIVVNLRSSHKVGILQKSEGGIKALLQRAWYLCVHVFVSDITYLSLMYLYYLKALIVLWVYCEEYFEAFQKKIAWDSEWFRCHEGSIVSVEFGIAKSK